MPFPLRAAGKRKIVPEVCERRDSFESDGRRAQPAPFDCGPGRLGARCPPMRRSVERGEISAAQGQERPEPDAAPSGLTAAEAASRLDRFGPNDPLPPRRSPLAGQLMPSLTNPLVAILLLASGVAFLAGERLNAWLIVLMIALSIGLNFWQTYRSHRAADRLQARWRPTPGCGVRERKRSCLVARSFRETSCSSRPEIWSPPTPCFSKRATSTSRRRR